MHADTQIGTAAAARTTISPRAAVLGVGLCIAVMLAVFWPTTVSMVDTWWRSATYQHCFFVIPIFMWLVWGERDWCFTPAFLDEFRTRFPAAEALRLPDAGHYVFEDAHERIVSHVRDFLAAHQATNRTAMPNEH